MRPGMLREQHSPTDFPDTQLYGFNHLRKLGYAVSALEPLGANNALRSSLIWFRVRHMLRFFNTFQYDIVFGSSILYLLLLHKLFRTRTKFVILNISLTRTLQANSSKRLRLYLLNWLLKDASAIVCLGHQQEQFLKDQIPELTSKLYVTPLGVDTRYYQPCYENRSRDILSVGRDNGRDYATLIDVARRLPQRNFVIICSKRNLVGITLPHNVTVQYDISPKQLRALYQTCQLLVLTTHSDRYLEGSDYSGQTVLLDAMASGLPVIATRKSYIDEYFTNGEHLFVEECYDVNAIVSRIHTMEDAELCSRVAISARTLVERTYNTERMAKSLGQIFMKVME